MESGFEDLVDVDLRECCLGENGQEGRVMMETRAVGRRGTLDWSRTERRLSSSDNYENWGSNVEVGGPGGAQPKSAKCNIRSSM